MPEYIDFSSSIKMFIAMIVLNAIAFTLIITLGITYRNYYETIECSSLFVGPPQSFVHCD